MQRTMGLHYLQILVGMLLVSCGSMSKKPTKNAKPFGEIPPELRGRPEAQTVIDGEPLGKLAPEVAVALQEHEKKELLWTDAEDMWRNDPVLDKILAAPKRNVWEKTEAEALRTAMREGKCVMIWFTDRVRSPRCKSLDQELFSKTEFGDWAKENVLRLMVDQSALISTGTKVDGEVAAVNQVDAMKKKYKVLGTPNVVMLSPHGKLLAKYRGFKPGTGATLWGQLKYSVGVGNAQYAEWLKSMKKRGYRVWEDRKQRKVVARLLNYNKGHLVMIEPDGNRFRTEESKLSDVDQAWITEEKRKRGME